MSQNASFHLSRSRIAHKKLMSITLTILGLLLLIAAGFGGWLWYYNAVQPAITSQLIQGQVDYAGLLYTIVRVQQSQRFLDDPLSEQDGMLRVFLRVENNLPQDVSTPYNEIARLILPSGKNRAPATLALHSLTKANTVQTGYLDFRAPTETRIQRLAFQLGRMDEAQIIVPLIGHADLKRYLPQKGLMHPATVSYQGLNWTIKSAMTSFGKDGQQAKKGMYYLTFQLSVANPLSQIVIPGSPFEYMRLDADRQKGILQASTLPVFFKAGTQSDKGEVTFVIPQGSDHVLFRLLALPHAGFDQATQAFSLKKLALFQVA